MAEAFVGEWTSVKDENFDEYLKEMGAPWVARKAVTSIASKLTIKLDGNNVLIDFAAGPMKNKTQCLHLDGSESEIDMQKEIFLAKASLCDGKLVIELKHKEGKKADQKVTREIVGNQLVQTMVGGTVTCKRYFEKK